MSELEEIKKRKLNELMKKSQYPDKPIEVTDKNFDSIIHKYPLILIDCWAVWCAPCRMIAPMIEELAKKYKGKIVFGKLDVNENMAIAKRFDIMAIPNLLIFKKGKLVDRIVGVQPMPILESRLKEYLGKS
ncbi:MAG: thioredoxin [Candidatus Aenigmarchaeota archaeon]|nr:thioredoxin [Candidatus Aenigmarchaeota archaeon]